jgi:hypothetical protein
MRTPIPCESEHDFVLILDGISDLAPAMEDALYEAGCDDATISVRAGRVYLTFSRTAPTMREAILSAIRNVHEANIGARVLRVDSCNLVTQSEIARKLDRTRQLVSQYIAGTRGPGGFPAPACNIRDGAPLWYWCEVASWLWQNDMIKEDVARAARDTAAINSALVLDYYRGMDPDLVDEAIRLVKGASQGPAAMVAEGPRSGSGHEPRRRPTRKITRGGEGDGL